MAGSALAAQFPQERRLAWRLQHAEIFDARGSAGKLLQQLSLLLAITVARTAAPNARRHHEPVVAHDDSEAGDTFHRF